MAHQAPKRTEQAQVVRQRAKRRIGTGTMAASLLAVGGLAGLVGVMGHDEAKSASTGSSSSSATTPSTSTSTSQSSSSSSSISASSSSSTPTAKTGGS